MFQTEMGRKTYELVSIVNHLGDNIVNGHYVAFAKKQGSKGWLWKMYNDCKQENGHFLVSLPFLSKNNCDLCIFLTFLSFF